MISAFFLLLLGSVAGVCIAWLVRVRSDFVELWRAQPDLRSGSIAEARAAPPGRRTEVQGAIRPTTTELLRSPLGAPCLAWRLRVACADTMQEFVAGDVVPFAVDDGTTLLAVPESCELAGQGTETAVVHLPDEVRMLATERNVRFPARGRFYLTQHVVLEGARCFAIVVTVDGAPQVKSLHRVSQLRSGPELPWRVNVAVAAVGLGALAAIVVILW